MCKVCDTYTECENNGKEYCELCIHNYKYKNFFKTKTYRNCDRTFCIYNTKNGRCKLEDAFINPEGECSDYGEPF